MLINKGSIISAFNPFENDLSPEINIDPNFYDPYSSEINDINNINLDEMPSEEPANQSLQSDVHFHANLAEELEDKYLDTLAYELLEDIKNDKEARSDWENSINLGFKYLGIKVEEYRNEPFLKACGAFDSTLLKELITAYSVFRAEMFPAKGPCAGNVVGTETKEKQDCAERVELFLNNYLTKEDKGYYPDSEQLIIYTIFCGSAFRKVYPDPVTGKPTARMIKPQDFIVNPDTTDLTSASRMTQLLTYTRKEILHFEKVGFYKEGSLPPKDTNMDDEEDMSSVNRTIDKIDGIDKSANENKMVVRYYECHVELDPNEIELGRFKPENEGENYRPYIVTMCIETKKIAAIRRGWKEDSQDFEKEIYFVNYYYIHGFGIYGLGLAHMMGSNTITLTSVLRQLIDSGSLKNFPAFLVAKGSRLEKNDIALGPAEGKEIDTAGMPIQQVIMPLPYGEPSPALMQLRKELIEQSAAIGAATQTGIPELGTNAPVGTTLALLEINNRVLSTVMRSFHFSLTYEFELLYKLFGKYLPDQPYPFMVPGKESAVMRQDFNDFVNITPVSDPNQLMRSHRIMQADAIKSIAQSNPQMHNMREVYIQLYRAIGVENIDSILPPPEKPKPLDALSENMNIMAGKGVVASIDQDHDSHIFLHSNLAQQLMQMQNIASYVIAMSHNQVHKAFKAILSSQELQQMLMPASQQWMEDPHMLLTIPQVQSMIDHQDLQEEQQKQQAAQQQAQNQQKPIDPSLVMMEEIKQKQQEMMIRLEESREKLAVEREEMHLKEQEIKLKTAVELEVNKLKAETEREKMELQRLLAQEKQRNDLLIEQMKHDERMAKSQNINQAREVSQ